MSNLHPEIFSEYQKTTWGLLDKFFSYGLLAGGTALALQLAHRKSYDFDFFSAKEIAPSLKNHVQEGLGIKEVLVDTGDELSVVSSLGIKISFIAYPFSLLYPPVSYGKAQLSDWRDIAADKAYTIGRRGEWRDYVDIYCSVKAGHRLPAIILDASKKFGGAFSEKLLLSQLYYMGDLKDFSVELLGDQLTPEDIKTFFAREVQKISF